MSGKEFGWREQAAVLLGTPLLRALASTWRYTVRNEQALESVRSLDRGFTFALWHGQLLPLMWHHRDEGIRVLISEHRDGEMIARFAHTLGFETVRGSTTRGGERALLGLARALQNGEEVAITTDGPRGPARRSQPGALISSARAGTAILPIAMTVDRAWHFRSWDRFIVPRPLARITVAYGTPFVVEAAHARDAAAQVDRLDSAINEAESLAAS